jgi:APA family basic amino acid/polyamine antiporter
VLAGSGIVFFSYIGFDAVATVAPEAKNPQRDMPIGILSSLAICTILYVAVALVLTGMTSYKRLDVAAPIALALDRHPSLYWLGLPVKIGAIAGMTSVMLVLILAQARIFLSMGRDGLLPKVFARVHPKFRTPSTATILTGFCAAMVGGLFPVGVLGELVSIGTLLAFGTVCIGVLVLRHKQPGLRRPFKTPCPWLTCTAGAGICAVMMLSLPLTTWIRLVAWTVAGLLIYVCFGYRNSKMRAAVICDPEGC